MKKAFIVILVLLGLLALGGGGYFLYTNVLSDMISGGNEVTDDGTYHISTDERFTMQIEELKEVVGKKQYKEVVASLDAVVNDFITYQPMECYDVLVESLYMPSYTEVQSINLDLTYSGTEATYIICTYEDGYYLMDEQTMTDLEVVLSNNINGGSIEESSAEETMSETLAVTETLTADMFEQPSGEASQDLLEMMNKVSTLMPSDLLTLEEAKDAYKVALNNDDNFAMVEEYVDNLVMTTATPECVVVGRFDEESGTLTLIYRLNDCLFNIFDINTSGDMNDYSQVFSNEVLYTPIPWYEYYPQFNGLYGGSTVTPPIDTPPYTESESTEAVSTESGEVEESSSADVTDF